MGSSEWFKCEKCGHAVRSKAPSWIDKLTNPCERCGGVMRRI